MSYTVLNAPLPIKLAVSVYGFVLAGVWYLLSVLIRLTLRVSYIGTENLASSPNHIYVFWHQNLPIYFATSLIVREKQIWMQHPKLFMKPIHIMLKMMGVKELAYGSSGNNGKEALARILKQLSNGYSTVITPDGPRGPVKKLKAGALIMAEQTGVPIIPVTMKASRVITLNTWDKKKWPLPFSHVAITYHSPFFIANNQNEKMKIELERVLSE